MRTDRPAGVATGPAGTVDPTAAIAVAAPVAPDVPGRAGARTRGLRRPSRRELAVAAGVGALDLLMLSDIVPRLGAGWSPALVVLPVYTLLAVGLLAFRRQRPGAVLVLLCLHSALAGVLLTYRPIVGVCVGLATVATRATLGRTVLAHLLATATSLTWVVNEARTSPHEMSAGTGVVVAIAYALVLLVPTGIGRWEHAGRRRVGELERRQAETARAAVLRERRRVAVELHDIVAHAVTVMVVQAGGARRQLGREQRAADAALSVVEEVGTEAMSELRRLLGVLRTSDGDDPAETGGPTMAALAALVVRMRDTGVRVTVETRGVPARLDSSVDRTGYRVVQEALTNVSKHAGSGATAAVAVSWRQRGMVIEVTDDGRGSGGDARLSTGHGLLGLAERVALVGGTLDFGPLPGSGYRVVATLPVAQAHPVPRADRATRAG